MKTTSHFGIRDKIEWTNFNSNFKMDAVVSVSGSKIITGYSRVGLARPLVGLLSLKKHFLQLLCICLDNVFVVTNCLKQFFLMDFQGFFPSRILEGFKKNR